MVISVLQNWELSNIKVIFTNNNVFQGLPDYYSKQIETTLPGRSLLFTPVKN